VIGSRPLHPVVPSIFTIATTVTTTSIILAGLAFLSTSVTLQGHFEGKRDYSISGCTGIKLQSTSRSDMYAGLRSPRYEGGRSLLADVLVLALVNMGDYTLALYIGLSATARFESHL
jgi:hypothetical protein